jgi:hypothetical protein
VSTSAILGDNVNDYIDTTKPLFKTVYATDVITKISTVMQSTIPSTTTETTTEPTTDTTNTRDNNVVVAITHDDIIFQSNIKHKKSDIVNMVTSDGDSLTYDDYLSKNGTVNISNDTKNVINNSIIVDNAVTTSELDKYEASTDQVHISTANSVDDTPHLFINNTVNMTTTDRLTQPSHIRQASLLQHNACDITSDTYDVYNSLNIAQYIVQYAC